MRRRYAAAAGVAGFVVAGLMGAGDQDPGEATLALEGRPGGIAITLSVGGKSREVVVEPVEGGRLRIRGAEGDLTARRVELTLGADRPVGRDTRFAPQPSEDTGPPDFGPQAATSSPVRGFGILPGVTFGRARLLAFPIPNAGIQNVTAGIQITPRLSPKNAIGDFHSAPPQPDLGEPMPRG